LGNPIHPTAVAGLLDNFTSRLHGRYAISREIGRGGMAVVYLAQDLRHDRWVARLHHPNLLPVYDSGEADGSLYYVVPYIEGGSLRIRLVKGDRFRPRRHFTGFAKLPRGSTSLTGTTWCIGT
jgi:serine/threonine protein kinase